MSILFADARLSTRPHGRWTTGLWLSVVLHAIVVVVLIVTPIRASEKPPAPSMQSRLVFVLPATAVMKVPSTALVAPRLPAPPRPMREPARAEVPKPIPVAPIVAKPIEPAPAPLVPAAAAPVFERPIEKPVVQRPPETGLFERTNGARTSQAAAAVTTGGFGSAAVSPRGAANGPVATGGFSSGAPAPRGAVNGEVQTAGFDQRASAQPSVAALTKPIDRPVEIVFKPTPEYTDEARRARIEGTVSLELEFTAAGDVRMLRVVRGLGHGLDEAAQRAALRIRFKPAQSDGRPVDSRATVHITFRLS
ncbi:MAG TPA: energy transducer TonB [Vicinamibacterales bacterium]|nr:energy transducer TonB [Vicinamibacterales bacterium]